MAHIKIENNETIFRFLRPNSNTTLRDFHDDDLLELLKLLNLYYLEFRDNLTFTNNLTFGFEIEFEQSNNSKIMDKIIEHDLDYRWFIKGDKTLDHGGEIASPVLINKKRDWEELKTICQIIATYSEIGPACGGHIHLGTQVFGKKKDTWKNFLLLWATYENIIFRFTAGEYINPRPAVATYANPVSTNFMYAYNSYDWNNQLSLIQLKRILGYKDNIVDRYQAVNLTNATNRFSEYDDNTIEIRCPNGTLEPIIWQNNLYFILALIKYASSKKFDCDTILKRYYETSKKTNIYTYSHIYIEQAIELADLIFERNIDKIYFLRQYLKTFESTSYYDHFIKAKTFIKSK